MGDARAHERQAKRDVHCPVHPEQFHRDVSLIVVERDDSVELAPLRPEEEGVGRQRTYHIEASRSEGLDRRRDEPRLFVTEQASFATMWVERGHSNPRGSAEQPFEHAVEPPSGRLDARGREPCDGRLQGLVKRGMDHTEPTATDGRKPEHHRGGVVGEATGPREQFRVAWHVVSGGVERFLVKRPGDYGGRGSFPHGSPSSQHRLGGGPPSCRRDRGVGDFSRVDPLACRFDDEQFIGPRRTRVSCVDNCQGGSHEPPPSAEHSRQQPRTPHHPKPGRCVRSCLAPRLHGNLRPDPSGVAAGQQDHWRRLVAGRKRHRQPHMARALKR